MERLGRTMFFFAASLFLVILLVFGGVFLWEKTHPSSPQVQSTIPITAEGKVFSQPDVAEITFTVTSEGKDPKVIGDENAQKVNAITSFLKDEGIKEKDIKTSQYSLQPVYSYPPYAPERKPVLTGYIISQSINIKIRSFEKAGSLIAGSIERGANQISSLVFTIEDIDKYKKEARELAFSKAKAQADDLARLGGFSIGKVLSIQEGYSYYPGPYPMRGGAEVMPVPGGEVTAPQIEPGSQEVIVTLTVVFKIE